MGKEEVKDNEKVRDAVFIEKTKATGGRKNGDGL